MNPRLLNMLGWLLPHRLYVRISDRQRRRKEAAHFEQNFAPLQRLAAPNAALKNRHAGARAFILANGPSTLQQNLQPLKGEIVFSVSSGYLHPQYDEIKPRYHCVPQITYGKMTEQDVIAWFREMHARTGDAELFLSATEERLVQDNGLFPGRTIHYVFLYENFDELTSRAIPDISTAIPRVQSVPIMALMIGLYMGCKDLYLLGTEHSEFITRRYQYSFEPTVLRGKDMTTTANGDVLGNRYDDFHSLGRLWRNYRVIREIADANDAHIWNATTGGELDEFPRAKLEAITSL